MSIQKQHTDQKEFKTAIMQLRMTPTLKYAIEQAAKQDHRSVNSLMEKLAIEYIDQNVRQTA